ncbi:hypothetical protein RUE5091_02854 [Ruegeria denitrificans]|uniref:Uncharacterized protein n=1 Tax=Ruegeria denitrificans TaxID=1715692 RepID=A0A0P1IDF8_9RHOB|nr:hypothetical protein RUE5091_02854 [Ruegeria denitrificans]
MISQYTDNKRYFTKTNSSTRQANGLYEIRLEKERKTFLKLCKESKKRIPQRLKLRQLLNGNLGLSVYGLLEPDHV